MLFARQELSQRYRGSVLGVFWLMAQPLALVVIFSVVFSELMGARLPTVAGKYTYSVYLIGGVLLWNAQANILSQTAQVFQSKAALLAKTPISLLVVPLYIPLVEFTVWVLGMAFFAVFLIVVGQGHWQAVWQIPIVVAASFAGAYLAGLVFGMLGVFLPDIRTGLPIVLQLLFWATPIVYVQDLLPAWLQRLQAWNPLYWGPGQVQTILLNTGSISAARMLTMAVAILALLWLVRFLVRRLERDIRDLI